MESVLQKMQKEIERQNKVIAELQQKSGQKQGPVRLKLKKKDYHNSQFNEVRKTIFFFLFLLHYLK